MIGIYVCPVCCLGMTDKEYQTHTHTAAEVADLLVKLAGRVEVPDEGDAGFMFED